MALKLSDRLNGVSESATLALNAAVQAMKAQGIDVVNLTAGEPDFPVHESAKEAVRKALDANKNKYTPVAGIPELRAAIAEKTNRDQPGLATRWKGTDVVVTNGGKQALYNAMQALLNPGDEVVVIAPYWLSYPEMAKIAGATSRILSPTFADGFKVKPAELKAAINARTKMVIFNSPSNPSGVTYSRDELRALGEVILASEFKDVWVLSDEIYDQIVFPPLEFCSFLRACPELQSRTITFNGMSKSGAMTGWRVGWAVGPKLAMDGISVLQGQSTSGINALAQWASLAVLALPSQVFDANRAIYQKRRDLALEILRKQSKLEVVVPEGAFYLFVGVKRFLREGEDSMGFAQRLLDSEKVAVVPGTPFGAPTFLRLSFATDEKSIQDGCDRIVRFCA